MKKIIILFLLLFAYPLTAQIVDGANVSSTNPQPVYISARMDTVIYIDSLYASRGDTLTGDTIKYYDTRGWDAVILYFVPNADTTADSIKCYTQTTEGNLYLLGMVNQLSGGIDTLILDVDKTAGMIYESYYSRMQSLVIKLLNEYYWDGRVCYYELHLIRMWHSY